MGKRRKSDHSLDIVITGNVAWQKDLSWLEKLLYGVIRGLTRNDYFACYGSNSYFAELLGRDESSIRKALQTLEKGGFVFRSKGWVLLDDGKLDYQKRMIVLTEHKSRFETIQETMLDLRAKSSKKSIVQVGKNAYQQVGKNAYRNNNIYPYEENIINNNIKKDITPLPPCKGETKGAQINDGEYLTFGKYENVRLTASEYEELVKEFGEEFTRSLIEQLSANIASGLKRYNKKRVVHSAILRDWALRRNEPKKVVNKKAYIGGVDSERRPYTDKEMQALFTPLYDAPKDAGAGGADSQ